MSDKPISPQQLRDDVANSLGETPISDTQNTDSLLIPPIPTSKSVVLPTKEKEKEKNEQQTDQPQKKQKKKPGKGILIAVLLFFIFTLPIALYYVTQSPQFAEIRSRAAGGSCIKTGVSNVCSSFNCSNFSTATTCSVNGSMCCTWRVEATPTRPPCKSPGSSCGTSGDCCNGVCAGGICQGTAPTSTPKPPPCKSPGSSCGTSGDCCNGVCAGGICQGTAPTSTPIPGGGTCPSNIAACKPGGAYYYEWLPNHVICGTCDRADNFNTCGTWQGESGVWKDKCCGGTCSGAYPWTFENQCLSSNTSNREACFHVEADCNRVQPCKAPTPTSGSNLPVPTNPPNPTNPPSSTNTPIPTLTPTIAPTNTPVATPTTTNNTPMPGTCDASCDTNSNCESGLSCVTTTGVKRCRKTTCPDESNCSCPSMAATPTTYYANSSPIPTRTSLIATAPTTIPTNQPTPKIPVAGVGPGFIGVISVVGSIVLLLIGLAL